MTNPITLILNWVVGQGLSGLWSGAQLVMNQLVFRAVAWNQTAGTVVDWSRSLALAALSCAIALGALSLVWDPLVGMFPRRDWSALLTRAAVAVVGMSLIPPGVAALLTANNLVTQAILRAAVARWPLHWTAALLALSPLILLAVGGFLVVVILLLGLTYAARAVHVFWIVSLLPWFLVLWVVRGDGTLLGRSVRQLFALVLQQAAQALAWWLTDRALWSAGGLIGVLMALGSLWFLVRVPEELAYLLGARLNRAGGMHW
jgi:hypothetical protein